MSRRLLLIFLMIALSGAFATPVSAKPKPPVRMRTAITLNDLSAVDLGKPIVLSGIIKTVYGKPIADKSIIFTINDKYLGQARSDESGQFQKEINNGLNAGTYAITATSNQTRLLTATSSSTELKILPTEIRVQCIPPIAGVSFQLDGQDFISGADGSASIAVDKIGEHKLVVLAEKYSHPTQRIEFGRWMQESYEPSLNIQAPTDKAIQVGINVYHLVGQSFLDPKGQAVGAGRVSEFTIRSAQGDVFTFKDGEPRWLPASRTAHRVSGLEETKLLYSVNSVMVDGSNVVNQSQQRFYTHAGDIWKISLIFYSLRVSAHDGLFGIAIGDSVNLEFPDGSVKNYPIKNGMAEIKSLPRGNYFVEFIGAHGLSNRAPVALSRDQEVHTKVLTYFDIGVVVFSGIILALGLVFYGRPWLFYALLRKKQVAAPQNLVDLVSNHE